MKMDESRLWLVFTVVCIASIIGLLEYEDKIDIFGEKNSSENETDFDTSDEMHDLGKFCMTHENLAMHFHPTISIFIDGESMDIPKDLGIDTELCPSTMHMTHTHDSSGKIHVEGHQEVDVPLEVFFDVWGVHFDENGIFDYRGGTISMTVNGAESTAYQNLILEDSQNIVISYTSN